MDPSAIGVRHDKVAELRDAFGLLDLAGDGYVDLASICTLVRAAIPSITEELMDDILKSAGLDVLPHLTFAQYYVVITKIKSRLRLSFSAAEMRDFFTLEEAFVPFDKERTGSVDADIFMAIMMEKGEKFCSAEATEMQSRMERMGFMRKGRVNYRAFINYSISSTEF